MEKIFRIMGEDFHEVNEFLELGWKVKMISSALSSASTSSKSICYVVLEKKD